MIIMIMATALIQCMVRTHAGWITFAGSRVALLSAAARLDIDAPLRIRLRRVYARNPGFVTRSQPIEWMLSAHRIHKRASRVSPGAPLRTLVEMSEEICISGVQEAGINTVSTTWITPFDWCTLEIETVEEPPLASMIQILPSARFTVSSSPSAVLSFLPSVRSEASYLPGTT